ncbi:DUF2515 domain-containing protein [Paenibacillus sp. OAS669]|uniref:DUF2515 domain-containing protein n=1 Tax=Paenibacillus sp. OAS669 TaxID=2663821 RepID=UPI001A09680E|nr:DUF2515 domain-containing protein [Paenibacillus sp. OAS669]MBE1444552.1 hypothetical protein [Paenibacillus sp. OAS669]
MMKRGKYRWNSWDLFSKLADTPQEIVQWTKGKASSFLYETAQLDQIGGIGLSKEAVDGLRSRLNAAPPPTPWPNQHHHAALIDRIRSTTAWHNRNNVTRTHAYLHMYRKHPELHWALLAHLVSRNGGWSMTDLKGELLPYLLDESQREHLFTFLERANALIFHDAYPQLLLYEASLNAGKPLFQYLRLLHVSDFMQPVWEQFWEARNSALLTMGLIINEQSYIEQRVVQHPVYRKTVLDTIWFQAQSLLQLNQVVIPYNDADKVRLAGLILENFGSLKERIEVGKKLYAVLFGIPVVKKGALTFALDTQHTGSRADYWPHLFAPIRQSPPVPKGQLKEWLDGCRLRPDASPLYSPRLTDAWRDRPFSPAEDGDWYTPSELEAVLAYLTPVEPPFAFEMTHEYCFGLNKIELAVLAGDLLH